MPFRRPPVVTTLTEFPERRSRRRVVIVVAALLLAGAGTGVAVALTPRAIAAGSPSAPSAPLLAVDTSGFPKGDTGIFTDTCTYDKTAANDAILMPGMTGKSMQHDFFGNTATSASSTTQQLVGGATSCSTSADASAYWTPVLDQDGTALTPSSALIYWRAPAATSRSVKTVPAGLTEIAGNESASTPQGTGVIGWTCSIPKGGAPTGRMTASPHDCAAGTMLRLVITFPNCWDGHTLNGAKQQNVVYPSSPKAACPASHPIQIPQIVFHTNYPTSSASGLTLSIGPDATGPVTTEHADFMNGWNERILSSDVAACTAAQVRCGPVTGATAVPRGGKAPQERKARLHRHAMPGMRAGTNA